MRDRSALDTTALLVGAYLLVRGSGKVMPIGPTARPPFGDLHSQVPSDGFPVQRGGARR
jgi:hypothetical protein